MLVLFTVTGYHSVCLRVRESTMQPCFISDTPQGTLRSYQLYWLEFESSQSVHYMLLLQTCQLEVHWTNQITVCIQTFEFLCVQILMTTVGDKQLSWLNAWNLLAEVVMPIMNSEIDYLVGILSISKMIFLNYVFGQFVILYDSNIYIWCSSVVNSILDITIQLSAYFKVLRCRTRTLSI